jgi:hypothetical protein
VATAGKKPPAKKRGGRLSALDAAAKVLGEAKEPLAAQQMIDAMATKGCWKSPGGKTPQATLYSAIVREIDQGINGLGEVCWSTDFCARSAWYATP